MREQLMTEGAAGGFGRGGSQRHKGGMPAQSADRIFESFRAVILLTPGLSKARDPRPWWPRVSGEAGISIR